MGKNFHDYFQAITVVVSVVLVHLHIRNSYTDNFFHMGLYVVALYVNDAFEFIYASLLKQYSYSNYTVKVYIQYIIYQKIRAVWSVFKCFNFKILNCFNSQCFIYSIYNIYTYVCVCVYFMYV